MLSFHFLQNFYNSYMEENYVQLQLDLFLITKRELHLKSSGDFALT